MKRSDVYKNFKHYKQSKDNRTMDEICNVSGEFELQVQQKFLRDWMKKYPKWQRLLVYAGIGSGKTCTSITMAENYLHHHKNAKITVILPARLRTNYLDELISPCGMNAYISQDDFKTYYDPNTSQSKKRSIKTSFMKAIEANYEILSFEKFKLLAEKSQDFLKWTQDFTKDRLIIIDEVHNLINTTYDTAKYTAIKEKNKLTKGAKGIATMLLKYLVEHADTSCKMVFMTATPVFDNIGQFKELVTIMNPSVTISSSQKIADVIQHLSGMVSFYPGTSPHAYPQVKYHDHNIQMSATQDQKIYKLQQEEADEIDDEKDAFMAKQRQASIACFPNSIFDPKKVSEYAPKIKHLVSQIESHKGKHIVYSSFIKNGLDFVEKALKSKGWKSYTEANPTDYKVYAIWDGSAKDAEKQQIKDVVNSKDNIDGRKIKVILGSPSVKEGVSFKHIQHLHLLDPVWNQSAKTQVEGRAIRFCSHIDISKDHPFLKRQVVVHIYKLTPRKHGLVENTPDFIIYDEVIPKKFKNVQAAENALKKVAIDYYLFRNMYDQNNLNLLSPDYNSGLISPISIDTADNVPLRKKAQRKSKATTCPKPRRPDPITGDCNLGFELRPNNQGFPCCYKIRQSKKN